VCRSKLERRASRRKPDLCVQGPSIGTFPMATNRHAASRSPQSGTPSTRRSQRNPYETEHFAREHGAHGAHLTFADRMPSTD
jgi:hypothetical protein